MQDIQVTLSVGTLIRERYLVKSLLTKGNDSAVYLVEDQRVKRARQYVFVLKEIVGLNQQERIQCIFDSVLLRQMKHPALPGVYHVFNDDRRGRIYFVMDYVEGPNLKALCQQQTHQRFTWPEVSKLMTSIVDAVSYLHQQETPIVHGDIKPINIIRSQPEEQFMLVDSGIIREYHHDVGGVWAMSNYKAPEQYRKAEVAIDIRADIYGLGAVFYSLLTGSVPPNALERIAQIEQGQDDPLYPANSLLPTIPLHVSQTIHRSMSIYAHERFSSVEEFWQILQAPVQEFKPTIADSVLPDIIATSIMPKPVQRSVTTPRPLYSSRQRNTSSVLIPKRGEMYLLLLILVLLVGAGAGTWAFVQKHQPTATISSALVTSVSRSATPFVTPTSSPGSYPGVFGSYTGTLVDVPTKASETIILQSMHQIGGKINGYFTVGAPLEISGPFSGKIDFSKRFQFIVNDANGHSLLFLEGALQTSTSLSGDFYACAPVSIQGETCTRSANDYGIWSALLTDRAK